MEFYRHYNTNFKKCTFFVDIPNWVFNADFCSKTPTANINIAIGVATCSPKDQFNKKVGRDVAKRYRKDHLFTVQKVKLEYDAVSNLMMPTKITLDSEDYTLTLGVWRGQLTFESIVDKPEAFVDYAVILERLKKKIKPTEQDINGMCSDDLNKLTAFDEAINWHPLTDDDELTYENY